MSDATRHDGRPLMAVAMEIVRDIPRLVRNEAELLRAELSTKAERAGHASMAVAVGLLLGAIALLIVLQAVVLALAQFMPGWLASLVVGVLLAAVGLAMVLKGQRDLKTLSLVPERTLDSLSADRDLLKEKME